MVRRIIGSLLVTLSVPVMVATLVLPWAVPVFALREPVTQWVSEVPEVLVEPVLPQRSVILDVRGDVLAEIYLYNREIVDLEQMSPWLVAGAIAVEDRRFYEHSGVDPESLARAVVSNIRAGSWIQGGSGITQQYVKNLLALQDISGNAQAAWSEATERTLDRKFREARWAVALEQSLSKEEIIRGYLNTAFFGSGTYGVEAAAKRYFGLPASELNVSQSALIVGLLQSPSAYDPLRFPKEALERRQKVLRSMWSAGAISPVQYRQSLKEPLGVDDFPPPGRCGQSYAPFYCAQVEQELLTSPLLGSTVDERRQALARGGLVISTGLNPDLQAAADRAMSKLPATSRLASAMAVVKPGTGVVSALATSRTWGSKPSRGQTQVLLPTVPAFQAGSVFKTYTLAAALNDGVSPDVTLPSGTTHRSAIFENPEKGYFSNYDQTPWSNLNLREATRWSVNTAYVQLQEMVGTRRTAQIARDLGVSSLPLEGQSRIRETEGSLTLGARETSVLDVASSYASLAAGGLACPARLVTSISGAAIAFPPPPSVPAPGSCRQVVSPAAAALTTDILQEVVESGTGQEARLKGRPAAGKTGTTNDAAAVWFAGYVPQLAAAVWIGDPRGPQYSVDGGLEFLGVGGSAAPALLWRGFMEEALESVPVERFAGPTRLTILGPPSRIADAAAGLQRAQS